MTTLQLEAMVERVRARAPAAWMDDKPWPRPSGDTGNNNVGPKLVRAKVLVNVTSGPKSKSPRGGSLRAPNKTYAIPLVTERSLAYLQSIGPANRLEEVRAWANLVRKGELGWPGPDVAIV